MKKLNPIKWIYLRSKKQGLKMTALLLFNAIFSILSILFAFNIKEIIDSATVYKSTQRLISFGVSISLIVLLQFALRVIINGLTEHIRGKLEMEYKSHLFSQILVKKQDKINAYHSGELLNILTADVSVVADGVSTIIPTVVSAGVRLISAVIALIILDWIFAVAFTVAGLLVFLVITLIRGKLKNLHKSAQESDGKVRSFMQECIENLIAVKVFSVNDKIERKNSSLQQDNFKIKMIRKNYSVIGHATYNFIFSAGYLFALIYGGNKILNGFLSYGELSAILQLVNNVQVPFASLSNVLPKYYAMIASTERLMDIENLESENNDGDFNEVKTYEKLKSIKIENASFSYGREKVLTDLNLQINKGDFVVIEGSSGIGKSTLIKLLLGVYPLTDGKMVFDTLDGEIELSPKTRKAFSYVPQTNMLFSGTIKENVTFINEKASAEEIDNALNVSCVTEFIKELPEGVNTFVGEQGLGLSQGQIQRIAIARALLSNAPIILFDEATSALDGETEKRVLDNLGKLKNKTLIIISHKKTARKYCNRQLKVTAKGIFEENKID